MSFKQMKSITLLWIICVVGASFITWRESKSSL